MSTDFSRKFDFCAEFLTLEILNYYSIKFTHPLKCQQIDIWVDSNLKNFESYIEFPSGCKKKVFIP